MPEFRHKVLGTKRRLESMERGWISDLLWDSACRCQHYLLDVREPEECCTRASLRWNNPRIVVKRTMTSRLVIQW